MTTTTRTRTPFVIPIKGHLIHSNRREFKQRVLDELERGQKAIIVDATETKYIDSAGLGVLYALNRSARLTNAQLIVAGLNEDMQMLFEITRIGEVIATADTVGAAIAKLGGEG